MSDPKVIYLGPICVEGDDERTWCDRDVWEHSDCEVEGVCTDPVKYIRADVVAELEAMNKSLRGQVHDWSGTCRDLDERIAELEVENAKLHLSLIGMANSTLGTNTEIRRLREAHQKNADQVCKNEYRLRKHLCEWREIADAMRQRSEAVLKEVE